MRRVKGIEYSFVRLLIVSNIWWLGVKLYKNPIRAFKAMRAMIGRFKRITGKSKLVRAFKVDGKYYWDIFNPGWPSQGFNAFFSSHLLEEIPIDSNKPFPIRRLTVAFTKRCPLSCEHCSEADTLYNKDALHVDEFISKIDNYLEKGLGQIQYSGGEPLVRFDDLLKMLSRYKGKLDQWVFTSGYGLTKEYAINLKNAGVNGVAISLDHFNEEKHNLFRGNNKSFYWVKEAIKNLQELDVFIALNICPTKELVESGGIENIIEIATDLNVPIINIIEPRAVGNYFGKNVELEKRHFEMIKALSNKYNFEKSLFDKPTVLFPAGYREKITCGGGRSYLFIDYDGQLYPCPFCKVKLPKVNLNKDLCEASVL